MQDISFTISNNQNIQEGHFMQDMAALKGKDVEVTVIEVDPKFKKIVLSMSRAVQFKQLRSIHLGALMWGEVRRVEEFGAFVGLEGTRISGLLHVSNISRSRVESVSVSVTAVFSQDCLESSMHALESALSWVVLQLIAATQRVASRACRLWSECRWSLASHANGTDATNGAQVTGAESHSGSLGFGASPLLS